MTRHYLAYLPPDAPDTPGSWRDVSATFDADWMASSDPSGLTIPHILYLQATGTPKSLARLQRDMEELSASGKPITFVYQRSGEGVKRAQFLFSRDYAIVGDSLSHSYEFKSIGPVQVLESGT